MCTLTEAYTESKTFTGYKRVLIDDGKFISPAMRIEYKEGMRLPRLKTSFFVVRDGRSNFRCPAAILEYCFNKDMQGRTAVYTKFEEAIRDSCGAEVIVKMTISGSLLKGSYGRFAVIAGRHIDKIETL